MAKFAPRRCAPHSSAPQLRNGCVSRQHGSVHFLRRPRPLWRRVKVSLVVQIPAHSCTSPSSAPDLREGALFARIAPYCHASFSSAPGLRELVVAAEDRSARLRHAFVSSGAYRWPSSLRLLVRLFSPFCTLESALPVNITVLPSCRSVSNLESLGGVS